MRLMISETAELFGVTTSLLRYYEKHGVIPPIKRGENGQRYYDEGDLDWISVVMCMKGTNMSIEEIQKFVRLNNAGDQTLGERLEMVKVQRDKTLQRIKELEKYLETIDFKIFYFSECIKEGTEKNMKKKYYASHIHKKLEESSQNMSGSANE